MAAQSRPALSRPPPRPSKAAADECLRIGSRLSSKSPRPKERPFSTSSPRRCELPSTELSTSWIRQVPSSLRPARTHGSAGEDAVWRVGSAGTVRPAVEPCVAAGQARLNAEQAKAGQWTSDDDTSSRPICSPWQCLSIHTPPRTGQTRLQLVDHAVRTQLKPSIHRLTVLQRQLTPPAYGRPTSKPRLPQLAARPQRTSRSRGRWRPAWQ